LQKKNERLKDYSSNKSGHGAASSVPLSTNPQLELSDTDDSTLVPVNPEGDLSDTDDSTSETSLKPGTYKLQIVRYYLKPSAYK
jgi:hypothetical protein